MAALRKLWQLPEWTRISRTWLSEDSVPDKALCVKTNLVITASLDYLFLLSHAFSPSCGRVCTLSCDHVHHAKLIGRAR